MRSLKPARLVAVALLVVTLSCTRDAASGPTTTAAPSTTTMSTTTTSTSTTSTTVPPTTTTIAAPGPITRPTTDPSICAPQSARGVEFTDHTLTLFAISREAPIPIQIIGDQAGDSYQEFALVERFFASSSISVGGDDFEIAGNHVRVAAYPNGNGNARWVLPDGSIAYLRSRGLDRPALEAIIARLTPRDRTAPIPGFDFDSTTGGATQFAILHEHLNTGLDGKVATVDCVSPTTGYSYTISAVDADPIVAYGGVIDRPVPLEVGVNSGTLIVINGRADPSAPTIADVVNADDENWAALLANAPTVDQLAGWPPPPTTVPSLTDVPMVLPAAVVSGEIPVTRREYADDPATLHDFTQFWVRPGPHSAVLSIETNTNNGQPPPDGAAVDVLGWDRAFFVHNMAAGYTQLWLGAPSGSVGIWAYGLTRDEVATIAASLTRRAGQPGWDVDQLPDGLGAVHEGWLLGAASRTIRSTGESPDLEMSIIHGVPSAIMTPGWFGSALDLIDINGHTGVLWESQGRAAVTWSPQADLTIVLGFVGPPSIAMELARSIVTVDKATWRVHTTLAPADDGCNSMFC